LLSRGRQLTEGKLQRAIVRALQSELHYDHVAVGIDPIELTMHVREGCAVVTDWIGEPAATIGDAH
jgi:hypothetical protein